MTPAWPEGVVVREQERLERHTALRTGGPCDAFVVVHRPDALGDTLGVLKDRALPLRMLGAGTRLVVRDGGLAGAVVRLGVGFLGLEREGVRWFAGGALPVAALVAATVHAGHGGLEGLAGHPGSVGASVALDDAWQGLVESVQVLARGSLREVSLDEARKARVPVVTGVRLDLSLADPASLRREAALALSAARAFSMYRVTGGDVRTTLRKAGVSGVRLRSMVLPDAAPESMVNLGGGTAADLALLQRSVIDRVARERGITLEPTTQWTGRHREQQ